MSLTTNATDVSIIWCVHFMREESVQHSNICPAINKRLHKGCRSNNYLVSGFWTLDPSLSIILWPLWLTSQTEKYGHVTLKWMTVIVLLSDRALKHNLKHVMVHKKGVFNSAHWPIILLLYPNAYNPNVTAASVWGYHHFIIIYKFDIYICLSVTTLLSSVVMFFLFVTI